MQRTFAIIKPDAVEKNAVGSILSRIEDEGFRIVGLRRVQMSLCDAEGFYAVHRERPFFADLVAFMSSGPAIVMALERDDAIEHWRKVIGATDPEKAAPGTIRKRWHAESRRSWIAPRYEATLARGDGGESRRFIPGARSRWRPRAPTRRS